MEGKAAKYCNKIAKFCTKVAREVCDGLGDLGGLATENPTVADG
jgi:hypothetical protein